MDKKLLAAILIAIVSLVIAIVGLSQSYTSITSDHHQIYRATPIPSSQIQVPTPTLPVFAFTLSYVEQEQANYPVAPNDTELTLTITAGHIGGFQ